MVISNNIFDSHQSHTLCCFIQTPFGFSCPRYKLWSPRIEQYSIYAWTACEIILKIVARNCWSIASMKLSFSLSTNFTPPFSDRYRRFSFLSCLNGLKSCFLIRLGQLPLPHNDRFYLRIYSKTPKRNI